MGGDCWGTYIFFTYIFYLHFTCPALVPLFLALLEREGGIRRMTGGSIFLTYISYLSFYSSCARAARAHPLSGATKDAKRSFFVDTTRHFQNIHIVRLQQQTTKRSGCTIYPRIRLIKFIPQMLTIAKGSAF